MIPGKEGASTGYRMFFPMIVFVLVALAGMYIIANQTKPQNLYFSQEPARNTINVKGEAKATVVPNELQLSFTIETNDTYSAKTAQEKNSDLTEKVKKALFVAGLNEQDLQTIQFSVEPIKKSRWECPVKDDLSCNYYDRIYSEEVIGYKAMHSIFIKSSDTKKAGEFLDAINVAAGNDAKINSVSFNLKDDTKKQLERDLLEKASQDAKNKAGKIASGMGVGIGKPTSVVETVNYPSYYDYGYKSAAPLLEASGSSVASTQIFAGQVDVTASVSASFEVN